MDPNRKEKEGDEARRIIHRKVHRKDEEQAKREGDAQAPKVDGILPSQREFGRLHPISVVDLRSERQRTHFLEMGMEVNGERKVQ
jgi:hypothetical protein